MRFELSDQSRRLTPLTAAAFVVCIGTAALGQHYESAKLSAHDGGAFDDFGYAVCVLGDVAIAGAFGDDATGGTDCGSAYLYRRSGSDWTFERKLEALDAAPFDYFGYAVELHEDMAIVGSLGDEPGGSVYVYRQSPLNGDWTQVQKIVPPDTAQGDSFGSSVDADGRYLAIGARMDSDAQNDAGSVYMYEYEESLRQWVYLSEFRASDPVAHTWFGEQLAISGDYVVVGLPRDDTSGLDAGAAYIFKRQIGTWIEQIKILPTDGAPEARFGSDVAVDGDTLAIGAPEDWPGSKRSGSVYVFRGSQANWPLEQKLSDTSDGAQHWDRFGSGVDLAGNTLLIGAEGSDANNTDRGSAYVYTRSGSNWTAAPRQFFAFDGAALDEFGGAVDLDGETAVVGAYMKSDLGQNSGAAYVFNDVGFRLVVDPAEPQQGEVATFSVAGGQPNSRVYLAYSIRGLRKTGIPQLGVTIELRSPIQAGGFRETDSLGRAVWVLPIPGGTGGRALWMQALQYQGKTNVWATRIRF